MPTFGPQRKGFCNLRDAVASELALDAARAARQATIHRLATSDLIIRVRTMSEVADMTVLL